MKNNEILNAIEDLENKAADLGSERSNLLRNLGWEYTCKTPGSIWLWKKKLSNGETFVVGAVTALSIEEYDAL